MLHKDALKYSPEQPSTPEIGASVPGFGPSGTPSRLLWFLTIPLALCIFGLFTLLSKSRIQSALAASTQASAAEPVSVLHPQAGDPSDELVLPATLQAFSEAPIYARTSGYVAHWFADIGQHVSDGEVLARIDSPDVDQQLIRARATLNQSQANLTLAGVTAKRYQDLIKSNSVAQQEVDQNNQNLTSQQAAAVSAAADVKQLEEQQSYERVTAPFAGVVTERRTDIGDLINAGNSGTGAELFRLAKIDVMRIFVSVPEAYSQQIATGMHVSVQLTELPNQTFDGQVARNNHAIDPATRTLMVEVDVPNPGGKLLPGAYGQVHFKLASPTRSLIVPSGSLLFQSAGPQVAVVTAKNTVELRKVVIGRDFGNTIEITNGISSQDSVIASPPDYLVNGMPVSVQGHADVQPPTTPKRS
ncbi:efflux RND transporter periplasmic adaptor subunit [Edaphobacter aggregans]|uniref:efflux RND transporter periplasmic adaptor subunit n=1 Tax=Edaphobacter aggregans TaxID=570835 RepID=UPI00068E0A6D|nr:efflux RND transporter periplasmic adaptor subunit [Edaphobacter aggregans]